MRLFVIKNQFADAPWDENFTPFKFLKEKGINMHKVHNLFKLGNLVLVLCEICFELSYLITLNLDWYARIFHHFKGNSNSLIQTQCFFYFHNQTHIHLCEKMILMVFVCQMHDYRSWINIYQNIYIREANTNTTAQCAHTANRCIGVFPASRYNMKYCDRIQ